MLSNKSASLLKDLFLELLEMEEKLDEKRTALSSIAEFEPYAAFQRIAGNATRRHIRAENVQSFLASNCRKKSFFECFLFVHRYASQSDQFLRYTEFMESVVPYMDETLRQAVALRPKQEFQSVLEQPGIEVNLVDLIVFEIEGLNRLNSLKGRLLNSDSPQIGAEQCFVSLDREQVGFLDADSIRNFLISQGSVVIDEKLPFILHHITRNTSGHISSTDLARFLHSHSPIHAQPEVDSESNEFEQAKQSYFVNPAAQASLSTSFYRTPYTKSSNAMAATATTTTAIGNQSACTTPGKWKNPYSTNTNPAAISFTSMNVTPNAKYQTTSSKVATSSYAGQQQYRKPSVSFHSSTADYSTKVNAITEQSSNNLYGNAYLNQSAATKKYALKARSISIASEKGDNHMNQSTSSYRDPFAVQDMNRTSYDIPQNQKKCCCDCGGVKENNDYVKFDLANRSMRSTGNAWNHNNNNMNATASHSNGFRSSSTYNKYSNSRAMTGGDALNITNKFDMQMHNNNTNNTTILNRRTDQNGVGFGVTNVKENERIVVNEFLKDLAEIIKQDRAVEDAKIDLLRVFGSTSENLYDCIVKKRTQQAGFICSDLREFVIRRVEGASSVLQFDDEFKALFAYFDAEFKGVVSKAVFVEKFKPIDPVVVFTNEFKQIKQLSPSQSSNLIRFFKTIVQASKRIGDIKKKYTQPHLQRNSNNKASLSLNQLFNLLDDDRDSHLSVADLNSQFEQARLAPTDLDFKFLLARFSKQVFLKISFSDFVSELSCLRH